MIDKRLEDMTFDEKLSWACGYVLVSIGEGKFRTAMSVVLQTATYEAYHRGIEEGKKMKEKK